jgi:hypothetical protein
MGVGKNGRSGVLRGGRKNMSRRILLMAMAVVAGVFWTAPPDSGADAVHKITLKEVLSIGGLDDEALFQWTGVAADSEGFIYVLDAMDYSLKKFDPRGALVKKTGQRGQGPGEFMIPRLLDASPGLLFVTDQNVAGIYVFDRELNFKKKIPSPALIAHMKALGDDRVAVAAMSVQGPGRILVLSDKGEILSELPYLVQEEGALMDSISFVPDADGRFYLAFLFQDRVEKWSPDGKRFWSKTLLGGKKSGTKKIASFTLPGETCFKDIALDRRGHVFVLGGHLAKSPSRTVFVLSTEGELLTTFTLPDTSHCLYIDRDNDLYVRANDGITLKKYRIVYE